MIRLFLLLLWPTSIWAGALEPAGRLVVDFHLQNFGGFSAIDATPDGKLLLVSDRGTFYWCWTRREAGQLVDVWVDNHTPILDSKGDLLTGRNRDAESIAVANNGEIYLSFERNNRIMRHADVLAPGEFIPEHPDFDNFQTNSGMEALAIDARGQLYTIPERSGALDRPFPLYRFDGESWEIIGGLERHDDFLVAGADIGPDGKLYVLERGFANLRGFHIRIRRYGVDPFVALGETLYESNAGNLDNFEGISVWQDQAGETRLTLVADDNFNFLQRTIIEEYIVRD